MTKAEIKKGMKLSRQVQDQLNKTRFEPKTISNNFTIPISGWILENGKYTANISVVGLTAKNYAEIFFDDSCSEIVSAAKISTEGETFEGGISITAENLPTDSISGSYYIFKGDSFMSKARVNSCNKHDSVFVGATSITSGAAGNVPAPLAGDQNKFLRGDGTWSAVNGSIKIDVVPTQANTVTYNGNPQTCTWNDYDSSKLEIDGDVEATDAGEHTVGFTPKEGCAWFDGTQDRRTATWTMDKAASVLSLSTNSDTVTAGDTTNFTITTVGDGEITVISDNTNVATVSKNGNTFTVSTNKSGSANITVSQAEGTNYLAPTSQTFAVTVNKRQLTIPTVTNTAKTYDGTVQSPTVTDEPSATYVTCTGKTGTVADDYTLRYTIIDTDACEWADHSTNDKTYPWSIAKATGSLTLSETSGTVTYGTPSTFTITNNTSGGALSVTSADTTYATATINGNTVTVNCTQYRAATTAITVTSAETENYEATTATYIMTAAKAAGNLTLSENSGNVYKGDTGTFTITATGDGEITVTSSDTSIATVSKNGNIVEITGVKGGTTTITVSQAEGTNHLAPTDKTYSVTVSQKVLNDYTWNEISAISQAGTGDTYFDIGDCKEITLNGKVGDHLTLTNQKLCVFILDFNHAMNGTAENNIIWGGFKSALTNGVDVALVDAKYNTKSTDGTICFNMNHWGYYNYGGWKGSDLRYDILGATSTQPSDSYYFRCRL